MSRAHPLHFLPAACLALLLSAATDARALFRAYLSVGGSDANSCALAAPCRLLPAALAAVDDGGEIWILDSGNFNTSQATVDKSVTILAIPGVLGSVVVNNADGISVNGPGIRVALRNLSFGQLSGNAYPLRFLQGASLLVENCRISGSNGTGLVASAAGAKLLVRDTVIRNNLGGGLVLEDTIDVTLDRVQVIDNAGWGISTSDGVRLAVSNSIVAGSGDVGIMARAFNGGLTRVSVESSTISRNFSVGFYAWAYNPGSVTQAVVARSTLAGNNHGAFSAANDGGVATLVIDGNTFAHQPTGTDVYLSGVIRTRQNNVYNYNGVDSPATPTPLAGQ
jgi:hypothetical protein